MEKYLIIAAVAIVCYFIGNINFALIISRLKKTDVRKMGSGNPGTMNMVRNFGTALGALTLFLDAFKGAFSACLGWFVLGGFSFSGDTIGIYIGGAAVILGHIYPVLLKFKGGKGIASSIGVCFVISPIVTAITFGIGLIFIILTKMGAITSFIIIAFPLAFKCLEMSGGTDSLTKYTAIILMLFILLLAMWAHRSNLRKMFTASESKTKIFSKRKNKQA